MDSTTNLGGDQAFGLPAQQTATPNLVFGQVVATKHAYPTIAEIASHVATLLGTQTFPVAGKDPLRGHKWGTEKARTTPGVQASTAWAHATGYAITTLPGSNLYIIDSDGLPFLRQLLGKFPDILLRTPVVYSGDRGLAAAGHCHIFVALTLDQPLETGLSLKDGQVELASLRGHGSYVVGPGSQYLESDRRYTSNSVSTVLKLDVQQTAELLALFGRRPAAQDKPGPKAVYLHGRQVHFQTTKDRIIEELKRRGYRQCGDWLDGPCVCPENHAHGDSHSSFGFNTKTGYGHCFLPTCEVYHPATIAAALGLDRLSAAQDSPLSSGSGAAYDRSRIFAFSGELQTRRNISVESAKNNFANVTNQDDAAEPQETIRVELNIAAALFRRGCYQSARFYDLLCHHSRSHDGQHTYTAADLRALGKRFNLSRDQVFKALRQLRSLGLLKKPAKAVYQRVSVTEVQKRLNLGKEYASAWLPREAFTGSPAEYFRVVLLAIEYYLPDHLATETIAKAAGVSRRAVYEHENALGVLRISNTERVDLATATVPPSFIKVFDAKGKFVSCVSGPDKWLADDLAQHFDGKAWGWKRLPSTRRLPRLDGSYEADFFWQKESADFA